MYICVMITSHGENMYKKYTVRKYTKVLKAIVSGNFFYILYNKHLYFCFGKKLNCGQDHMHGYQAYFLFLA